MTCVIVKVALQILVGKCLSNTYNYILDDTNKPTSWLISFCKGAPIAALHIRPPPKVTGFLNEVCFKDNTT